MSNPEASALEKARRNVQIAKRLTEDSDYDDDASFTRSVVEEHILNAEKFIELGEKFFNPPSSSSL